MEAARLLRLLDSVNSWRKRFPGEAQDMTQVLLLVEEIGEMARALLRGDIKEASLEAADALFVLIKIFDLLNLDDQALEVVAQKNDQKHPPIYTINPHGKVVRSS
jgi:NTP pyrophosphatase (non-canonical NTP hydrolase)